MIMTSSLLPWDPIPEEESRFRRWLLILLFIVVIVGLLVKMVKVPEPPRALKPALSESLVKLVIEQKEKPKPPPVIEKPKEDDKPKPEDKPKPVESKPDETQVTKADNTPKSDGEGAKKAKAHAEAQKHIAVFDALADLRVQAEPAARVALNPTATPTLAAPGEIGPSSRALIADRAKAGSGGVVTGRASVDGGGGGGSLSGTGTSRVVSGIGGLGGEGSGIGTGTGTGPASAQAAKNGPGKPIKGRRTGENIALGFDAAHGALQALYQRALRTNPDMKGKVVFSLEIQADGHVSKCDIVSSELGDPELDRKLAARVRQIDFGAQDADVWHDTFYVDFFPS